MASLARKTGFLHFLQELDHRCHRALRCAGPGHHLDEGDQVGRVEVVRDDEPLGMRQRLGEPARHEARGVARDDRLRGTELLERAEELVLRGQVRSQGISLETANKRWERVPSRSIGDFTEAEDAAKDKTCPKLIMWA